MGLFPQRFIDDVKLQTNIVQVVQEYVTLKRVGKTYKGLCPFHAEKTPSFHVDAEKGFFHCFGCHVGGDVVKFLELHEKVGFHDGVRMLAQRLGMALPEEAQGASDDGGRDQALREGLLTAHQMAAVYFQEQLASPAGARARQQLKDRGLSTATIEQLGLGFAPVARSSLKAHLLTRGCSPALLIRSGLVLQREGADEVDRFRNRLMVPICRETGSVIAFGGRAMDPDQTPKYLNSPETPIYSKGRTLYGLHLTKPAIRRLNYVALVEGYFDFAQVFQSQAAPVVASCGTALTVQQARLLHRFTKKIVLSFDRDAAGEGAAARSCELLVAEGFEVNVVALDPGEDPDTFIRSRGVAEYRNRLRVSRPYLDYLLDQAAAGLDFGRDETRRHFLDQMLTVAARIPDAAARDQFGDRIAHRAKITEDVVRAEIRRAAVQRRPALTSRELPSLGQLKEAEKGLVWGLFHNTREVLAALGELDGRDLDTLAGREIFELARNLGGESSDLIPSTLLRRLSTMDAQVVTSIAAGDRAVAPVSECVRALKRLRCERERAALQREIDRLQEMGAGQHGNEIDALWHRKRDLLHRIEELA